MTSPSGSLIISIDFELYWGVRDKETLSSYGSNLLGCRGAIDAILKLFDQFGIHATWATVGFLFYGDRQSLIEGLPKLRPNYLDKNLDPYPLLDGIGVDEKSAPLYLGQSLIQLIGRYKGQEIGSHSFSHFYCLEPGQSKEEFREDLRAACRAAEILGINLRSFVFPRNQVNPKYFPILAEFGIYAYRGNGGAWFNPAVSGNKQTLFQRLARLSDSYFNFSGFNGYVPSVECDGLVNVPASRFFRPTSKSWPVLDRLREKRIKDEMEHAAQSGNCYHLWWHPHNMGRYTEQNIAFLTSILEHYDYLHQRYGMESLNMSEVAQRAICSVNG